MECLKTPTRIAPADGKDQPFLVGRRNCLGQALANTELTGVVARLCANYEFEVIDEGTSHFSVTMQPFGSTLRV
jgi:cytochrome P450